ncbi:hypothetical protein J421_5085 (plasmid) [Gemmatirosa kalamazoonensis]|uniref:Uncharacterized protein n=1 Tax=Gemmatirosa kalamazoonensis TaxID=861299 RepID=W0RQJ9_9BACT|nr:hypothetical protein [Gemmatirosa kalamazoonensis]AHG92620.1 hypothetical protein J421_5085 [Gemmatirosa kalamazoonensis]
MPSDDQIAVALAATAVPRERFRAAVVAAAEQIDAYLDAHRAADAETPALAALGAFARGRVDAARFAALFDTAPALAPESSFALRRAGDVLRTLHAAGDAAFAVDVPPGGDLHAAVQRAVTSLGRAYAAGRVFRAVRAGVYRAETHAPPLDGLPFARWNAAARDLAPPLVIEVDDADLRAVSLAELLDGQMKLVLVVRGASAGAPLVRLITPGVLVMQTANANDLATVASFDGPAVAALVPESAARFVHDPTAGGTLAERLAVHALPAAAPATGSGDRSAWQLREELAQLAALGGRDSGLGTRDSGAVSPRVPSPESRVPSARVPSGRVPSPDALVRWLLAEAGL